jgi:hypothetical protein
VNEPKIDLAQLPAFREDEDVAVRSPAGFILVAPCSYLLAWKVALLLFI